MTLLDDVQRRWMPVFTGMTKVIVFACLLIASPAGAQEKVRVLICDGLPAVALNVPKDFSIKDYRGGDLPVDRDESGEARLELDGAEREGGVCIDAGDSVVKISKYSLTGLVEIKKNRSGRFMIINEVGLEDYTKSVVGEEMSSKWPIEALKAQAVIARTYALNRKRNRSGGEDYDLCASVNSQVFMGGAKEKEGPAEAARETEGEVLTWQGEPIESVYHSSCGGETEDASDVWNRSYEYLKARECPCGAESPYYKWERSFTPERIERALSKDGIRISGIKTIKIIERSGPGKVKKLKIISATGQSELKGVDFRRLLGYSNLPSTSFEVRREEGRFVFAGRGAGHGVGLCQWGAKVMADEGKTYKEILEYYYPGTVLSKLAPAEGVSCF